MLFPASAAAWPILKYARITMAVDSVALSDLGGLLQCPRFAPSGKGGSGDVDLQQGESRGDQASR